MIVDFYGRNGGFGWRMSGDGSCTWFNAFLWQFLWVLHEKGIFSRRLLNCFHLFLRLFCKIIENSICICLFWVSWFSYRFILQFLKYFMFTFWIDLRQLFLNLRRLIFWKLHFAKVQFSRLFSTIVNILSLLLRLLLFIIDSLLNVLHHGFSLGLVCIFICRFTQSFLFSVIFSALNF